MFFSTPSTPESPGNLLATSNSAADIAPTFTTPAGSMFTNFRTPEITFMMIENPATRPPTITGVSLRMRDAKS